MLKFLLKSYESRSSGASLAGPAGARVGGLGWGVQQSQSGAKRGGVAWRPNNQLRLAGEGAGRDIPISSCALEVFALVPSSHVWRGGGYIPALFDCVAKWAEGCVL